MYCTVINVSGRAPLTEPAVGHECTEVAFALCMQSTDPDVRATAARIKQFVMDHTYREPPEGSELPEYDQSTDVGLA